MDTYIPKPWHMLMPLAMFALGTWSMLSNAWRPFGMACFGAGAITAIWIGIAGVLEARINYLTMVNAAPMDDGDGRGSIYRTPTKELSVTHIKLNTSEDEGSYQLKYIKLPVPEYKLSTLAQGLINGQPFSERQWTGLGKPFSSQEFRDLRNEMSKRGLINPVSFKDPRQGYALTAAGRAIMRHYVPSPTPQEVTA